MQAAYSILLSLAVWCLLVPWHLIQILFGRLDFDILRERLGRWDLTASRSALRLIVHAVSVGEVLSVEPLLTEILKQFPSIEIILTAGTREGLQVARRLQQRLPQVRAAGFLPWDRRAAIRSWLQQLRPDLLIVVETELWPNLFLTCRQLAIPICIVNGRIYSADVKLYRMFRRFFRKVLSCAPWIGVQNDTEKLRFIQIGAPAELIEITGNIKIDSLPDRGDTPLAWKHSFDKADLVLTAACTHHSEERLILECFSCLRKTFSNLKLVLAPRHIRRSAAVENLARRYGFHTGRFSSLSMLRKFEVIVVDEVGLLASLYRQSTVVIIGGTFVRRGGHNFLEAAARECAVVMGPNTFNFESLVREFRDFQAIVQLDAAEDLESALRELFENQAARRELGRRALRALEARQGASRVCALAVSPILEAYKCNQTSGARWKMSRRF